MAYSMARTRSSVVRVPELTNAVIGGLVASCACCSVIPLYIAPVVGLIAAILTLSVEELLVYFQVDDAVGAVPWQLISDKRGKSWTCTRTVELLFFFFFCCCCCCHYETDPLFLGFGFWKPVYSVNCREVQLRWLRTVHLALGAPWP